jgi:hypothetical protein
MNSIKKCLRRDLNFWYKILLCTLDNLRATSYYVFQCLCWQNKGDSVLANKNPTYKIPGKFLDAMGRTIPTKRVSVPEYLISDIEAIAKELHLQHLANGTAPTAPKVSTEEEPLTYKQLA